MKIIFLVYYIHHLGCGIKEYINLKKIKELSINNWQINWLAKLWYIFKTIFNYKKDDFVEWKNLVKNKIKDRN